MQDQKNSMSDSGELQDVESNYSGRLSYVSSQPAINPSSRSMLSRDRRVPLDTWNTSGLQENVVGNQFSTFDSPRDHPQGIHSGAPQREQGSVPQATGRTGTLFTRDDKQNRGAIPMPTFAGRPWTVSSFFRWNFRRILWLDSKDSKFRSCNSTNSLVHNHFEFRRYDSKIK